MDDERSIRAEAKADMALEKIDDHERVCAERYKGINDDLTMLSKRLWNLVLLVLAGVVGIFLQLIADHVAK